MTIRKQLMRSAMIGHHVKQDKISLKILKKNQKHPTKVSSLFVSLFINYRTRYSRLFEASKGTSLFSIKVSIKGRWFGRNRAAERRLAAKSNPRWRVEKGRKKKSTMATIQEGESCQETPRLVALFLLSADLWRTVSPFSVENFARTSERERLSSEKLFSSFEALFRDWWCVWRGEVEGSMKRKLIIYIRRIIWTRTKIRILLDRSIKRD